MRSPGLPEYEVISAVKVTGVPATADEGPVRTTFTEDVTVRFTFVLATELPEVPVTVIG